MTRSLFKLRNTFCFFMVLKSTMSSGSNRACSTTSATYPSLPFWKSLINELAGRGDPSSTKGGFQFGTLVRRSHPLSPGAPSPRTSSGWSWLLWPLFEAPSPKGGHLGPLPSPPSLLGLVSSSCHQSLASGHEQWEEGGSLV